MSDDCLRGDETMGRFAVQEHGKSDGSNAFDHIKREAKGEEVV